MTEAHQAVSGEDFFSMPAADEPVQTSNTEENVGKGESKVLTDFLGVYVNTHKNKDKFKYRAAISQYDSFRKQEFWTNLGYFNCPLVAALAYNTAALGMYMGKAKLNYIGDLSKCAQDELDNFKKRRGLRIRIAQLVMSAVKEAGEELNYVNKPA